MEKGRRLRVRPLALVLDVAAILYDACISSKLYENVGLARIYIIHTCVIAVNAPWECICKDNTMLVPLNCSGR